MAKFGGLYHVPLQHCGKVFHDSLEAVGINVIDPPKKDIALCALVELFL